MKIALLGVIALTLTGCSTIFPTAAPRLAKAVNQYCTKLSEEERRLLRQTVNEAIQPNQACVYCAGDAGNACRAQ